MLRVLSFCKAASNSIHASCPFSRIEKKKERGVQPFPLVPAAPCHGLLFTPRFTDCLGPWGAGHVCVLWGLVLYIAKYGPESRREAERSGVERSDAVRRDGSSVHAAPYCVRLDFENRSTQRDDSQSFRGCRVDRVSLSDQSHAGSALSLFLFRSSQPVRRSSARCSRVYHLASLFLKTCTVFTVRDHEEYHDHGDQPPVPGIDP